MYNPNRNQFGVMSDPYQKLGKRLSNFAILALIYGLLSAIDIILLDLDVPFTTSVDALGTQIEIDPLSIFIVIFEILVFIFQIMIIIFAKKAASQYNKTALNQFGTYMVISLILSIASNVMYSVGIELILMTTTTGTINMMGFMITSAIVKVFSVTLQLLAWLSMFKFLGTAEAVDIQARSMPWTKLILIAFIIYLGEAIAIEITKAIMAPVITVYPDGSITIRTSGFDIIFEILGAICMIAVYVLACIGYFRLGEIFVSLGALEAPAPVPPTTGMAYPGSTSSSQAPGGPSPQESTREGFATCSFCGARFTADSTMQFCPNCGARFRTIR